MTHFQECVLVPIKIYQKYFPVNNNYKNINLNNTTETKDKGFKKDQFRHELREEKINPQKSANKVKILRRSPCKVNVKKNWEEN